MVEELNEQKEETQSEFFFFLIKMSATDMQIDIEFRNSKLQDSPLKKKKKMFSS